MPYPPTKRQKNAVKHLLEGTGSVGEAMRKAKYASATAKNPSELTESKGFKELMAEYGLTEKLITSSLVDDINAKPKKRVEELKLGAKILKMTEEEKSVDSPKELHLHLHRTEKVIQIVSKAEEELKKELEHELIQSVQKNGSDNQEPSGENAEETGGDSFGADTGGRREDESPELVQEPDKQD